MKFTALLSGLIIALPIVVFGASIPADTAIGPQARALDGDAGGFTGLQARALGDVQVLETRGAADIAKSLLEVVNSILERVNADNKVSHWITPS